MKMDDIRSLACAIGIKPGKLNKTTLVRNIQRHEGNFDCFATDSDGTCDQAGCLWRDDCHAVAKKNRAA